jgi:hypothetical protein
MAQQRQRAAMQQQQVPICTICGVFVTLQLVPSAANVSPSLIKQVHGAGGLKSDTSQPLGCEGHVQHTGPSGCARWLSSFSFTCRLVCHSSRDYSRPRSLGSRSSSCRLAGCRRAWCPACSQCRGPPYSHYRAPGCPRCRCRRWASSPGLSKCRCSRVPWVRRRRGSRGPRECMRRAWGSRCRVGCGHPPCSRSHHSSKCRRSGSQSVSAETRAGYKACQYSGNSGSLGQEAAG